MPQPTHEIGVRIALGAQAGTIRKLVMGEAIKLVFLGLFLGLACALALKRLVAHFLFQLSPYDPATLAMAAGILVAVAALAGYLPARRAMRVDPVTALRNE